MREAVREHFRSGLFERDLRLYHTGGEGWRVNGASEVVPGPTLAAELVHGRGTLGVPAWVGGGARLEEECWLNESVAYG